MKTYTFTANTNSNIFNNDTDYSKALDNIILNTMMKNNAYLFENTKKSDEDKLIDALFDDLGSTCTFTCKPLKDGDKFIKACNFLANYGKDKSAFEIPYKLNKLYRLADGTPIIFYDDEIQIGTETYKYYMFGNENFLSTLKPETKNVIININIKL